MPESPANADGPNQPARPWCRLHLSTAIVLVPLAAVLAVLMVRGDYRDPVVDQDLADWTPRDPYRYLGLLGDSRSDESQHGWPLTYLRRRWRYELIDPQAPYSLPWLTPQKWKYEVFAEDFSGVNVAIDVVLSLLILVLTGVAVEWRRRHRQNSWQFRLWELLAAFVAVAGVFGWWQTHQQRYRRESEAVFAMCYPDSSDTPSLDPDPYTHVLRFETAYCGPKWLRKLAPPDYLMLFKTVVCIDVGTAANDLAFEQLQEQVKCLPNLRCIRVSVLDIDGDRKLTDGGLVHLRALPGLEEVWLEELSIANDILPYLADLRSLRVLNLSGTQINDDGLKHLTQLDGLAWLDLHGTAVSDAGLVHLRRLQNLQYLNLSGTRVSNQGLEYVSNLGRLRELDLAETPIGDAGLTYLSGLRNLEFLDVYETQVTPEGIDRLGTRLPNCLILVEQSQTTPE